VSGGNGHHHGFAVQQDVLILEKFLGATAPGGSVSYEDIAKAIGVPDIRDRRQYGKLSSARRRLERAGIFFLTVMTEGLRRLTDVEFNEADQRVRSRERRLNRRAQNRLLSADPEKLTPAQRAELFGRISLRGVVEVMHRPQVIKKIASKAAEAKAVLPTADMLRLFE
jgi:hypothetical protein